MLADPARLTLTEHSSPRYAERTRCNARDADLTVAFAVDFASAGERLTHRAAGDRYAAIDLATASELDAARTLWRALRAHNAHTLNVAGNSIATLAKHGWTQERANAFVHAVLRKCAEHWRIEQIRSGGQTGIDQSGLVAALALGVPAVGLLPRGFLRRDASGVDHTTTQSQLRDLLDREAASLDTAAGDQPEWGEAPQPQA